MTISFSELTEKAQNAEIPSKTSTGVDGLDAITGGGWPQGRTTLIEGGPGCGKTILALQSLVYNAQILNEPSIFVAFEESARRIVANAAKFGWDLPALQEKNLFFLDAQPNPDLILSGSFDLSGLLATLAVKADQMKATRIAFDSIDVILNLMIDPREQRREIHRLHEWLVTRELTALITCKRSADGSVLPSLEFMQYMVDCCVILKHDVVLSISQRNLRVLKYRGSSFEENETPFVIGAAGLDVASAPLSDPSTAELPDLRISSGVKRLDAVLGGGYYSRSSVLITGLPGTAKTTLCGAFVEAACERGEPALFVSFDTNPAQVVTNLASVNIHLARFVESGLLRVVSARSLAVSAEIHLMQIKAMAREQAARHVVVDPISALSRLGNALTAHSVSERLLDWAKSQRITLLCTSLLVRNNTMLDDVSEASSVPISTIADTWIHLSYVIHAGERNRSLSIVKSRGTWHSNQVRELVLHEDGVTLTDAYSAGGEVLMGTLRWEKERAEEIMREEREATSQQKRAKLELDGVELEIRLKSIQRKLAAKKDELALMERQEAMRQEKIQIDQSRLRAIRGSDEKGAK